MSLTSHIASKESPVRAFFDRELAEAKPVCQAANAVIRDGRTGGPPVAPVAGADLAFVGAAIEFVFAAVGGTVRPPHVAGARTPELAYQRSEASRMALAELDRLTRPGPLTGERLERAADCALVCARLEQRFRMPPDYAIKIGLADPAVGVPEGLDGVIRATQASKETQADLIALLEVAIEDTADLYQAQDVHIDPVFALSLALGGADADLIADELLIDFKSTKDRSVIGSRDIYQLLGYTLADLHDWYGIRRVGIQALRWRTRWTMPVDELLQRLSGTAQSLAAWRQRFASVFPEGARTMAMRELPPQHRFTRTVR